MPDRFPLQSPGTAERLTPREIRLRQLAKERARMPKSAPPEPPKRTRWMRLADLISGIDRLKGQ